MKKTDIIVIGGSAAGIVAALTAKSTNPSKDVTLIRKEEIVMIPCGIPYVFGTTGSTSKNAIPDKGLLGLGVNIVIDEVTVVNKEDKIVSTASGEKYKYDKLVFATGSNPALPMWLKGRDLENVFTVPKNKLYLDSFQSKLKEFKKMVVIGAGFIGVEMSDELNKSGLEISLVEKLPHVLGATFDEEVVLEVEDQLTERGIKLFTGLGVAEILGENGVVNGVLLDNGEKLEADAVIVSMGYRPNAKLAEETGLRINQMGFIETDQYRRTSDPSIFAAGDCSEKRDFITGKLSGIMLASTASAEGRIAGINLYNLAVLKSFAGTIGIYSTALGDNAFAVAGITESLAKMEGIDYIAGSFTGMDRHPGNISDAHKQMVKLVVSRESGIILGGAISGGKSTGELINAIGFVIQNKMTVIDLLTSQIGTQPVLTASPVAYPLIKAAEVCLKKLRK
ncbi:FAD-dependent oxidoreductase [Helicovermis profundi]|uniref:FAD-dependent oxidoreductase n=1 Tax=Helicovermis profundi TaxID=3065157 RepID=A0AAU9E816_9FIRM|nr:FAD-dependent oxidoreductase [Clostridia bacterium S502]